MLVPPETLLRLLKEHNHSVHGIFHVGAHECEELPAYINTFGVDPKRIVWIDALQEKVDQCVARGFPNVYQAVITDKDNDSVTFHIANNGQSSSVLEFGTHEQHHSWVHYVSKRTLSTTTVDTFFRQHGLDAKQYDFWNFDIQGAELMALRGASESLQFVNAIYLEVNTEEVYKQCGQIHEIDAFLGERGLKRIHTEMTPYGWGDALYVRV